MEKARHLTSLEEYLDVTYPGMAVRWETYAGPVLRHAVLPPMESLRVYDPHRSPHDCLVVCETPWTFHRLADGTRVTLAPCPHAVWVAAYRPPRCTAPAVPAPACEVPYERLETDEDYDPRTDLAAWRAARMLRLRSPES